MADRPMPLDHAARYMVGAAARSIVRRALNKNGKQFDIMAAYGRAYAKSLLIRRELERLGHAAEVAALGSQIRKVVREAPAFEFAKPKREPPDPAAEDPAD